jgi:hypothetical protein
MLLMQPLINKRQVAAKFTWRLFASMSKGRMRGALAMGALLLALPMGGCATSIADLPLVGVPADAPARPKEVGAYPAVHEMPQDRPEAAMDAAERNKVSSELIAARDRQAATGAAQTTANPAAK